MIDLMIGNYQRELENLEWHLETNGWALSPSEKDRTEWRIRDRKQFIKDLIRLKESYEH